MQIVKVIVIATLTALMLWFAIKVTNAYELPGIPPSGSPYFLNDVKVDYNENSGRIKVTGRTHFSFNTEGTTFTGNYVRVPTPRSRLTGSATANDTSKYSLVGQFDDSGFITGTLSIRGGIDSLGIPKNTLLMTADLTDWNIVDNPLLLGFATSGIWCSPLLLVNCTENESVYVVLQEPFIVSNEDTFRSNGLAVTTVPIPAALLMFLTGLAVLVLARYPGKNINKL